MAKFKIDLLTTRYDKVEDIDSNNTKDKSVSNSILSNFLLSNIIDFDSNALQTYSQTLFNINNSHSFKIHDANNSGIIYNLKVYSFTTSDPNIIPQINSEPVFQAPYWDTDNLIYINKPYKMVKITYNYKSQYNFSYNEKFSIHLNSQKDLNFDMDSKLLWNDEWVDNPYILNIHVGSQLLLTDTNHQQHLFTVTNIKFTINNVNITYHYTCKDSFNYQLTHQQTDYNIKNDPTSTNFIGAQTLDYWGSKIVRDCYIPYQFESFRTGLYQSDSQSLQEYEDASNFLGKNIQIIKDIYSSAISVEDPRDYYQQLISFQVDNQNPMAALIALGNKLDCQVKVYEHLYQENDRQYLYRYFWFEPVKKNNPTGLSYKPDVNIQNFNLEYTNDNLATVLNVHSNTINDKVITMLPSVPPIFLSYFLSKEWESSIYKPGMYHNWLNGMNESYHIALPIKDETVNIRKTIKIIKETGDQTGDQESSILQDVNIIAVPVSDLKLKSWYPYCNFSEDQQVSSLTYSYSESSTQEKEIINHTLTSTEAIFYLFIPQGIKESNKIDNNSISEPKAYYAIPEGAAIPSNLLNASQINNSYDILIGVIVSDLINITKIQADLYLKWYRQFNEEEALFARIADSCPWLENKLINFTYLLNHKILSPYAYQQLLNLIQNDLRRINGKLLGYTQAYYASLHKETKFLADLEAKIDKLGAICYNDIVLPYQEQAQELDFSTFDKYYSSLFQNRPNELIPLTNYNELLSQYFNKTLDAEQRFLRAIYNFSKYFHMLNAWTLDSHNIQKSVITLTNSDSTWPDDVSEKVYYSFKPGHNFQSIYNIAMDQTLNKNQISFNSAVLQDQQILTDIYSRVEETYQPIKIATKQTLMNNSKLKQFYIISNLNNMKNVGKYSDTCSYLMPLTRYENIFGKNSSNQIVTIANQSYVMLLRSDLKKYVLFKNPSLYYTRQKDTAIPFDWIRYSVIQKTSDNKDYDFAPFKTINLDVLPWHRGQEDNKPSYIDYLKLYINNFPLSHIYYYGPVYEPVTKTQEGIGANNAYTIKRYNEYHYDSEKFTELQSEQNFANDIEKQHRIGTDPSNYQTLQEIPFINNLPTGASQSLMDFNLDAYLEATTRVKDSFDYYACCQNETYLKQARNLKIAFWATLFTTGLLVPMVLGPCWANKAHMATLKENCQWLQKFEPYCLFEPVVQDDPDNNKAFVFKYQTIDSVSKETDWYALDSAWNYKNAIFAREADSFNKSYLYTRTAYEQKKIFDERDTKTETWQAWFDKNKQYFNYYGLIAATYSLGYPENKTLQKAYDQDGNLQNYKLWVKQPSFYRIMRQDQYINKKDQYAILILDAYDGTGSDRINWTIFNKATEWPAFNKFGTDQVSTHSLRFNAAEYNLLLSQALNPLDLSQIADQYWYNDLLDIKSITTLFNSEDDDIKNGDLHDCIFTKTIDQTTFIYMILHYEPYETFNITTDQAIHTNWDKATIAWNDCDYDEIYASKTDAKINLLDELELTDKDEILIVENTGSKWELATTNNSVLYYKYNNNYYRTYTITDLEQQINTVNATDNPKISDLPSLYFIPDNIWSQTNLDNFDKIYQVPIYKHTLLRKENADSHKEVITHDITLLKYYTLVFNTRLSAETREEYLNNNWLLADSTGKIQFDSATLTLATEDKQSISPMSNGEFWYKFHNKTEWPNIFEQCILIETQLTQSWSEALAASKYCRFFLPDTWLPNINNANNNFNNNIIINTNNHITLSNMYIPEVKIDQPSIKYRFYYNQESVPDVSDPYHNIVLAPAKSIIEQSIALKDFSKSMKIDVNQWKVQSLQDYTYYYVDFGGTEWKDLIRSLHPNNYNIENMNGWYGLMFTLLRLYYQEAKLPEYESLLAQKQEFWTKLYKSFPNILVEDTYTNEDATTSAELFQSAQLYFKDKLKPEEKYTFNLINTFNLEGYYGQELNIGDAIQLDMTEWTDNNTDLYHSLNTFLFISDINYDLRRDDNISVTVNTVKYQEKLLQQLVSLIR